MHNNASHTDKQQKKKKNRKQQTDNMQYNVELHLNSHL